MTEKMQFNVTNGINRQDIISEMSTSGSTTDSNITQAKKRKYEQLVSEEPEKIYFDENNLEHALCKLAKTT